MVMAMSPRVTNSPSVAVLSCCPSHRTSSLPCGTGLSTHNQPTLVSSPLTRRDITSGGSISSSQVETAGLILPRQTQTLDVAANSHGCISHLLQPALHLCREFARAAFFFFAYRNTSHVIFLMYITRVSKCVSHHMARERVCAHHTISMVIHDVRLIDRLFSLCASPCSFPCVSPTPCSSLPNSTCTPS